MQSTPALTVLIGISLLTEKLEWCGHQKVKSLRIKYASVQGVELDGQTDRYTLHFFCAKNSVARKNCVFTNISLYLEKDTR